MTPEAEEPTEVRRLGLEPEELDGHTLEELSDYLDAGRQPPNPSIEGSAGCRIALEAMERLRGLVPVLAEADAPGDEAEGEAWVQRVLAGIALDAKAGRRIPIPAERPDGDLGITEGAVRGIVRGAERCVPGLLIGRCRLEGELAEPGAPVRVHVETSMPYGEPVPVLARRLREEILSRLAAHTELRIIGVDVHVHDIRELPAPPERDEGAGEE